MLEELIKDLDKHGILVMQILLGQRAMELLDMEKPMPKRTILHA